MEAFRAHRGLYGRSSWCRACKVQDDSRYHEENRELINAKKRAVWSQREITPQDRLASAQRARAWYAKNRERSHACVRRWAERNRDARNAIQQKRRARKRGVTATLTPTEWLEILDQFNRSCAYCLSSSEKLTMDHLIRLSGGGTHAANNVVPACQRCNSRKGARSIFTMISAQAR